MSSPNSPRQPVRRSPSRAHRARWNRTWRSRVAVAGAAVAGVSAGAVTMYANHPATTPAASGADQAVDGSAYGAEGVATVPSTTLAPVPAGDDASESDDDGAQVSSNTTPPTQAPVVQQPVQVAPAGSYSPRPPRVARRTVTSRTSGS